MSAEVADSNLNHSSLHRELPYVCWEGALANVFIVLTGGAFLTGVALYLGAGDLEIGLLGAIPFFAQTVQLLAAYAIDRWGKRKQITLLASLLARQLWWLLIPLLFISQSWRLTAFLVLVILSSIAIMIATPGWLSWMADIFPNRIRGRVFGTRSAAVAVATVSATVLGGLILDHFHRLHLEATGFAVLTAIACLFALAAVIMLRRVSDKPLPRRESRLSLTALLKPLRNGEFRRMLRVFFMWNLAIGISAAFFAPHMLTNLKMNFTQISLYSSAVSLAAVGLNKPWGKVIDHFGSKPVIVFCAFGIALIPMVWLFPRADFRWILGIEAIYTGALWTGFNLAAFNMPLAHSPSHSRTTYLAVFSVVTGIAFFLASLFGGILAEWLAPIHWHVGDQTIVNYHFLFVISALLRLAAAFMFLGFHEPREQGVPVMIQFMGYAILKRIATGRQLLPFGLKQQIENELGLGQLNKSVSE